MPDQFRDKVESALNDIPEGPLDVVGQGNVVGGVGYFGISTAKTVVGLAPGVKEPGYKITGHGTEDRGDFVEHSVTVAAVSRQIAKFAAKYESPPSNLDYLMSDIDIVDSQVLRRQRLYNIYRFTVHVPKDI